ncbi:hypothetical protein WOLCODRAFT_19315 [Wolfiporia cocos MD-104 SS10]|uniref:Uncharacterized protein n=1 Tax=Wolfiporia cocos (strain MD-104) TaxID=742152 RepID=A0A2H3JTY3_WOLCO|nr:hypothetical protein WOLCODRAFT_19315 [Wolfiporia cocos MD-104 SS10]
MCSGHVLPLDISKGLVVDQMSDTAMSIVDGDILWSYFITNHANVTALETLSGLVPGFVENGVSQWQQAATTLLVQCCYTYNVWHSSGLGIVYYGKSLYPHNLLYSTVQVLCMITFNALPKDNMTWIIWHFMGSRIYVNSYLAMYDDLKIVCVLVD